MGHDAHFLERLDRVNDGQVELALRLYRDDGLLRYLFQTAGVSESVGRVAISLDHDTEGPFVVVSRSGAFVTCLGTGMSPRPHPVITRGALDTASRRIGKLRETIAASNQDGDGGRQRALWHRVYNSADALCREDFAHLMAIQPLVASTLFKSYFKVLEVQFEHRMLLRRIPRFTSSHHVLLRHFWNRHHTIGYLMMLLALSGPKLIESLPPEASRLGRLITLGTVQQGMQWTAMRAAWAAGKLGKPVLALYKAAFAAPDDWYDLVDAGNGLLALACRHARLRAEIRKALHAQAQRAVALDPKDWRVAMWTFYDKAFERCVDRGDERIAAHEKSGRGFVVAWTREALKVGHRCRYEREEDVPKDLAHWWQASWQSCVTKGGTGFAEMIDCLPWAARARPEDFFLPRDLEAGVHSQWEPSVSKGLLDAVGFQDTKAVAHVAPPTPGRNEPCACGSGKKFKKCCAA